MAAPRPSFHPVQARHLASLLALILTGGCGGTPSRPTPSDSVALAAEVKAGITPDELMSFARDIVAHERPSGSVGENAAIDGIVAALTAAGVQVDVHEIAAYASDPVSASVTVPGTGFAPPAITMAYSATTEGVTGRAVDMGTLQDLPPLEVGTGELLGLPVDELTEPFPYPDLSGQVAVVDGQPRNVPTAVLERLGATAVIFVNPEERLNDLIVTSTWGSPSLMNAHRLPQIPVAQITKSAGEELRDLMSRGPVTLRVETELDTGWRTLRLAVARIEPIPDAPYVLLGGHIDGWYHGATDEGASNAAMLSLTLAFHRIRDRLSRGLVVAWWPGHSNARYAGSTWFADQFFTELRSRGLAYVNIDGIGQTGATRFGAAASEALQDFAREVVLRTEDVEIDPSRPGRNSDQSFNGVGLPLVQFNHTRTADDGGYWWWHTPDDTYDKIDAGVLKTDTDLYAEGLTRLLVDDPYPIRLAAQVEALEDAVARREAAAVGTFGLQDALGTRLDDLSDLAARVDRLAAEEGVRDLELVAALRPLHRVMYVPLTPYHPDPGVGLGPLPGLAPAEILAQTSRDSDRAGFALPVLMRERNRLVEALDQAIAATRMIVER